MEDKVMDTEAQKSNDDQKSSRICHEDTRAKNNGASSYHIPPITQRRNNIHHVVPVGVLVVLFTLYLTPNALQRNYGNQHIDQESEHIESMRSAAMPREVERLQEQMQRQMPIGSRLREYDNVCMHLEIFKDLNNIFDRLTCLAEAERASKEEGNSVDEAKSITTNNIKVKRSTGSLRRHAKRASGHRKVNGHKHSNKSGIKQIKTVKQLATLKKDPKEHKKNSTAEPIIYLFALVFIYLLLKAASDINQHYKSQSKGDKRLRRCSLQSYAQIHKQDRRASKDSPIRQKQRLLEFRSVSVDRYTTGAMSEYDERKADILTNLRKHISMEGSAGVPFLPQQVHGGFSHMPTWLGEHNEFPKTLANSTEILASVNRRCSVPVPLNYQMQILAGLPSATIANTSRRTSIASGNIAGAVVGAGTAGVGLVAGSHFENIDMQLPESRRRVRMINRH